MVKLTETTVYIRTKTSVENVKKLNLWGCNIDDIAVCEKMTSLEVLSLSVNNVESLEPLKNCKKLKELYLRKNKIESLEELHHLKGLTNLRTLWIDDNPCTQNEDYRCKVVQLLPQLTKLDDKVITTADQVENLDESVPECDMVASFHSVRSSRRSSSHSNSNDLMTRSLYREPLMGRSVVETVVQPQLPHFGDTSDEDRPTTPVAMSLEMSPSILLSNPRHNIMSQSVYGALAEEPLGADDEWTTDFSVEDDYRPASMDGIANRMYTSMHESLMVTPERRPQDMRQNKITSAVSVLLDELDQEGLRQVVEEAQRRMKKQR
ncbi:unnamed protein product [Caenorhabditis auriculariae]|uniref:U2A'/phosphoprotein 32 family A C-terminal domain-containing protein n=1 Tax=Caenorhabditis auriculariae TaxID=2777116 RepID=A0A8S1HT31_9PELO|nr:unnamed protein product [Caenorhabditis auriculariae]